MVNLPEHAAENQRHWNETADAWIDAGRRAWEADEPFWGFWGIPESQLGLLPEDLSGLDGIELGCGTGYVSAWLVRRGATMVGIDVSDRQLATAAAMAHEHDVDLTLIHGTAEAVPFPDDTFDLAISEYGAALWCDPDVWLPEAARILRPGGRLILLTTHPLAISATPLDGSNVGRELVRPWFDLHRQDWRDVPIDPGGIDFNLPLSGWVERFLDLGFAIEAFHELRAPEGSGDDVAFFVDRAWARDFPAEMAWVLRLG